MNTDTANTVTLETSTLGPLTLTVGANRASYHDAAGLTCWIRTEPFDFKYGHIEYTCTAGFGHYRSSRGLEPLRLESTTMDRKPGHGNGGPTENARTALWVALREALEQLRTPATFELVWAMTCSDAEDCVLREHARVIQQMEDKVRKLGLEREAYERMGQQPPATAIA